MNAFVDLFNVECSPNPHSRCWTGFDWCLLNLWNVISFYVFNNKASKRKSENRYDTVRDWNGSVVMWFYYAFVKVSNQFFPLKSILSSFLEYYSCFAIFIEYCIEMSDSSIAHKKRALTGLNQSCRNINK